MNLFNPSFLGFFRNKKIYLYLLGMAIIISMLIVIFQYRILTENIYTKQIKNNIKNRTLIITKEHNEEISLNDFLDIQTVVTAEYCINPITIETEDYKINLKSAILLDDAKIIQGRSVDNSCIEMVIPNTIKYLAMYLDSYIYVPIENQQLKIKIVGIYDDSSSQNCCYVSNKAIAAIGNSKHNFVNKNSCLVVVDTYEDSKELIEELKHNNFNCNLYNSNGITDINTYKYISLILNILIIIISLLIYIILSIIISNIIDEDKKDIAIQKAIGYTKDNILRITIYRICIISIISYFLGLIIGCQFFKIIIFKFTNSAYNLESFSQNLYINYYTIIFLILVILSVIACLNKANKIKFINPIILLKE